MRAHFNLNDTAEVTLTEFGAQIYNEWESSHRFPAIEKRQFKEGDVLRDQLWHLFQIFGSFMILGGRVPFQDCEVRFVK